MHAYRGSRQSVVTSFHLWALQKKNWKVRWTIGFNLLKTVFKKKTLWESLTHNNLFFMQFYLILLVQDDTEGKREPRSSLSQEFGRNPLTTQATAVSAWWTLPNVGVAKKCNCYHIIWTFLHPSALCHTALSFPYPLLRTEICRLQKWAASQRARKVLQIQNTISQVELRRETHTTTTKKTLMTWSEIFASPSPMLNFWHLGHLGSNYGICLMKMCKSQVIASIN